tara:strand:- start:108 stop:395 length:288 start_codon:yes stop_codon:yes gene_type:complete
MTTIAVPSGERHRKQEIMGFTTAFLQKPEVVSSPALPPVIKPGYGYEVIKKVVGVPIIVRHPNQPVQPNILRSVGASAGAMAATALKPNGKQFPK